MTTRTPRTRRRTRTTFVAIGDSFLGPKMVLLMWLCLVHWIHSPIGLPVPVRQQRRDSVRFKPYRPRSFQQDTADRSSNATARVNIHKLQNRVRRSPSRVLPPVHYCAKATPNLLSGSGPRFSGVPEHDIA